MDKRSHKERYDNGLKTRREVAQSGANGFIPKPVDAQRLGVLVAQILELRAARAR